MLTLRRSPLPPLAVKIDPDSSVPLYRQLYDHLRELILTRTLPSGALLPSTRTLATELSISRMTVVVCYEQLLAEGYIEGKLGSGTYVSHSLPDDHIVAGSAASPSLERRTPERTLSRRGAVIALTWWAMAKSWFLAGSPQAMRRWRPPNYLTRRPELFLLEVR